MRDEGSYRFEPLERRGLLLGLGLSQLIVLAAAVLAAIGLAKTWPGAVGFLATAGALASGGLLCRPVAGRPPSQWLRVAATFASRRRVLAQSPPAVAPGPALRLPARTFAPGVYLCELPATNGQTAMGTLLDEKTGTAAALLRARGGPFCLLDEKDKEHQLAAWASVLESVSAQRSSLARLQWCRPRLASRQRTPSGSPPVDRRRSQPRVRRSCAVTGASREKVVAARDFSGRFGAMPRTSRASRADRRGTETLRNQVRAIRAQMRSAGFVCEGVLDAAGAATAIGGFLVAGLNQNPGAFPWPLAVEEHWSEVRAEGCWHRTFWVAEWPRSRIRPDFLSPLLVGTARRSVSVVMAPIPPERAARDAESSRTAEVADAQLRAQGGFLQTARQRRQAEALEGRETELADGRGAFELAGYITVSASDKPGLEEAASELERAAGAAKLSLRPLYGQQKEALGWALPFGRGI